MGKPVLCQTTFSSVFLAVFYTVKLYSLTYSVKDPEDCNPDTKSPVWQAVQRLPGLVKCDIYIGWKLNSGNYLFTTDTK
jgi:hypothetical protein